MITEREESKFKVTFYLIYLTGAFFMLYFCIWAWRSGKLDSSYRIFDNTVGYFILSFAGTSNYFLRHEYSKTKYNYIELVLNIVFPTYFIMMSVLSMWNLLFISMVLLGSILFRFHNIRVLLKNYKRRPELCQNRLTAHFWDIYKNITTAAALWAIFILVGVNFDFEFLSIKDYGISIEDNIQTYKTERKAGILNEKELAQAIITSDSQDIYAICNILQKVTDYEAKELGIPFDIDVEIKTLGEEHKNTLAYYCHENQMITFNLKYIKKYDLDKSISTCLHEVYHAYEHAISQSVDFDKEIISAELCQKQKDYRENFANYLPGHLCDESSIDIYRNQIVELDSEAYSKKRITFYRELLDSQKSN